MMSRSLGTDCDFQKAVDWNIIFAANDEAQEMKVASKESRWYGGTALCSITLPSHLTAPREITTKRDFSALAMLHDPQKSPRIAMVS